MIINYDKDYQTIIYELVSINPKGDDIMVEYLIKFINPGIIFSNDIKSLNLLITKFILSKGIKRLLSMKNPIEVYKDICLGLYPINDILRKSRNENQNIKLKKRKNKSIDYNINNYRIIYSFQTTGFNHVQKLKPQTNNDFTKTQFKSIYNNNLMDKLNTINLQDPHHYLKNNNKCINNFNKNKVTNYFNNNRRRSLNNFKNNKNSNFIENDSINRQPNNLSIITI